MDTKRPLIGNPTSDDKQEDPRELLHRAEKLKRLLACATSRKERCEDLMQRRIAKTWEPVKKAKMVRRLVKANQEIEQSTAELEGMAPKLLEIFEGLKQVQTAP